jgi:hypothetical protein
MADCASPKITAVHSDQSGQTGADLSRSPVITTDRSSPDRKRSPQVNTDHSSTPTRNEQRNTTEQKQRKKGNPPMKVN